MENTLFLGELDGYKENICILFKSKESYKSYSGIVWSYKDFISLDISFNAAKTDPKLLEAFKYCYDTLKLSTLSGCGETLQEFSF